MASTLLMGISKDEHERAVFRSRRMAETDNASNILTAEARGELRERNYVLDLLNRGLTIDEIKQQLTGVNTIPQ